MELVFRPLAEADYDDVLATLAAWSGGQDLRPLLPHVLFSHFADTSVLVEDGDAALIGFVIAFASQTRSGTGFVHFVWVRPDARHRGVARQLYERVFDLLRDRGCCRVEAVTVPENAGSLLFHERMGFAALGHDGPLRQAPIVRDHSGAGQDRVVLRRGL